MDDWQLLNDYAMRNSEEAFRTLVDRYAGMVYHAALRQLGNPHAAEEVTQAVFIALAQKAGRLSSSTVLCGWLFRATRFAVLNLLRTETCRRRYEQQAMDSITNEAETVWQQIAPHLDEALERLPKADRELVITRFFGNKSHKELALALGITEVTAKKRLSRALEKLRSIFSRRGVAVSSIALLTALGAFAVQAAPAGLTSSITTAAMAHGTAALGSSATLADAIIKLMAWAKAKTALAFGTGVLLAAAGTATVALKADTANNSLTDLARQTGKHLAWDKHLALPASLDLTGLTLEKALDKIAVQAEAYWTVDYVVYDSDAALRSLLNLLHEGTTLDSGGWTNLSSMALEPHVAVIPYNPHGRVRMFMRLPGGQPGGNVAMMLVLGPDADPQLAPMPPAGEGGGPHIQLGGPPPDSPASKLVRQAMADGVADGVLAPERLLAETRLLPAMNPDTPVSPTPETAASLARAAHAKWTTVYTLRKSPIKGAGIKLVHAGMENMYGPDKLPQDPAGFPNGLESNRFNLSPEDRDAHQRAVDAWKKQQH